MFNSKEDAAVTLKMLEMLDPKKLPEETAKNLEIMKRILKPASVEFMSQGTEAVADCCFTLANVMEHTLDKNKMGECPNEFFVQLARLGQVLSSPKMLAEIERRRAAGTYTDTMESGKQ